MEITSANEILPYIVVSAIGGIGFLAKYILNKRDENQKRIFEQRDADKAEMKNDIAELKADLKHTNKKVNDIASIIIGCEHPDCPSRKLLSDFMQKEQ